MRGWLLVPLIAMSGCLYLGRVNEPPTITLDQDKLTTSIGGMVALTAHPADDEDDTQQLAVTFTVSDAKTGQPLVLHCDYEADANNGRPSYSVSFLRAGVFNVAAQTFDHHGAPSNSAIVPITVVDLAPVFDDQAVLGDTANSNACSTIPAGETITLGLTNGDVHDPDALPAGVGCGNGGLQLTWRIAMAPPGSRAVLTAYNGNGCQPRSGASGPALAVTSSQSQVCLWTDSAIVSSMAAYTIVLEAADGASVVSSKPLDVIIVPDALPCITGTNPAVGSYVIDRAQSYGLAVASVADDRDVFGSLDRPINFVWSVSTNSDPTWRDVPDYALSAYTLDPSSFGVGEVVHVRVEAIDSTKVRASSAMCAATTPDCDIMSCSLAGTCHKWRTWDLELR